jgi:hypothetical protein
LFVFFSSVFHTAPAGKSYSSEEYVELQNINGKFQRQIEELEKAVEEKAVLEDELARIKEAQEAYNIPESDNEEYYIIDLPLEGDSLEKIIIQDHKYETIAELSFGAAKRLSLNRPENQYQLNDESRFLYFGIERSHTPCYAGEYYLGIEDKAIVDKCEEERNKDYAEYGGLWVYDIQKDRFSKLIDAEELIQENEFDVYPTLEYVTRKLSYDDQGNPGVTFYEAVFEYHLSGYTRTKIYHLDPTDWRSERVYE